jgi:WS/DGAT/MGAT family acyltransferase
MTERIRLSALDAAFLLAETRNTPLHVAGLQIFRIPPGAPRHFVLKLFEKLRGYPVSAPPLNYRLQDGPAGKVMPSWEVIDDIDLDCHLRHSALPFPGGERELGMLVSRLHSNPMDLSRPLWEFHLIEGLAGERFAIYCKLHHALMDGVNGMKLLNLPNDRAASFVPPFWAAKTGQNPTRSARSGGRSDGLRGTLEKEIEALPSLLRGLSTAVAATLGVAGDRDLTSISEAPRTMLNVRVGEQRRVATHAASMARVQAIGRAAGGTVNDVVLAACSGALRRYLGERGALPGESLIAAVPMALRHEDALTSGNAVTCLNARLATNVADVRERFEVIRRTTESGKAHLRQMTPTAAIHFTMIIAAPAMLLAWLPGFGALARPLTNLIVSNLAGPRDTVYFHGAEMVAYYPVSQVGHGLALNITVLSYAGQLSFGLVACRDSVPSVQRLALYIGEALDELEATFLPERPKAATSRDRRKRPRPLKSTGPQKTRAGRGPRAGGVRESSRQ